MAYTPRGSASGNALVERAQGAPQGGVRAPTAGRRRDVSYWLLGAILVVSGALTSALLVSRSSARVDALALARDVPVGQPLTVADLRVESVLVGTGVPVVPAEQAQSMVGRVAAVPLRAGRLLAPDDVGPGAWPPAGQVLLAVAVSPGTAPPELAPGMHVLVGTGTPDAAALPTNTAWSRNGLAGAPEGVVAQVRDTSAGTGGRVVSLLLTREGAGQVTGIPATQLRLVVLPAPVPTPDGSAVAGADAGQPGGAPSGAGVPGGGA